MNSLTEISRLFENLPYVRIRRHPDMQKAIENLEREILHCPVTAVKQREYLEERLSYLQKNKDKPWAFALGYGKDYVHYKTFEECIHGLCSALPPYSSSNS